MVKDSFVSEQEQSDVFLSWMEKHKGLMFKIVKSYADTTMDQEDLLQDIALQIWRSIPAFRNQSAPITWIYRVALNTAITWIRREKKRGRTEDIDRVQHVLSNNTDPTQVDDQLTWLYREIHQLDKIDRSITLLLLDEMSYKEIASILGISESNVAVKIHRIKKHLISKSKNYHYGI
jgi:RNA polymerase sigma-70 factor, ECF subfamily